MKKRERKPQKKDQIILSLDNQRHFDLSIERFIPVNECSLEFKMNEDESLEYIVRFRTSVSRMMIKLHFNSQVECMSCLITADSAKKFSLGEISQVFDSKTKENYYFVSFNQLNQLKDEPKAKDKLKTNQKLDRLETKSMKEINNVEVHHLRYWFASLIVYFFPLNRFKYLSWIYIAIPSF